VELPPTPTPGGEFVIPKINPIFGTKDVIPTLESSALTIGDPAHGKELFNTIGCSGCHSTGSNTIVGPGLGGVKARSPDRVAQIKLVPRQSLSIIPDRYIEDSIVNPQNFVVPGFENVTKMETFTHLSRQELADVIAYVESLP
jgi:cytochrome c2